MTLNINTILFVLLAVTAGVSSCSKDPQGTGKGASGNLVEITLEIPGAQQSKALLTDDEENTIETIDLLLFKGASEDYSSHYAFTSADIRNYDNPGVKAFKAELPVGDGHQYRIVLFANARDAVSDLVTANAFAGKTKADILNMITLAATQGSNPLSGWEHHNPALLPMWGESRNLVTLTATTTIPTIQMLRSLARMDVELGEGLRGANDQSENDNGYPKFVLEQIALFNVHGLVQLAPDNEKYSHATLTVSDVSIPGADYTEHTVTGPLIYDIPDGERLEREIYLAEHKNRDRPSSEHMRIAVRGRYNDNAPGWYRVDLVDSDKEEAIDIIRNFVYTIRIADVNYNGASTPEDAFEDRERGLQADIIPWNRVDVLHDIEGDYTLTVSESNFEFNADGRNVIFGEPGLYNDFYLQISTDYSYGWEIRRIIDLDEDTELSPEDSWTTIKSTYNSNYIYVTPNTGNYVRHARIDVRAGKWEHSVYVTQDHIGRCGRNNKTEDLIINGNSYATHLYIDTAKFFTVRCWMVENLKETESWYDNNTDYVIKQFEGKEPGQRGYYYNTEKMQHEGLNPCPKGWHLPIVQPYWEMLRSSLTGRNYTEEGPTLIEEMSTEPHIRWWLQNPEENPSYAGYIRLNEYYGYLEYLYWGGYRGGQVTTMNLFILVDYPDWDIGGILFINQHGQDAYPEYLAGCFEISLGGGPAFAPVRCVKDMDNKGL